MSADAPIPEDGLTFARHRYVNGRISVKCDSGYAYRAFRQYGGRVEVSTVIAYPNGRELLGVWEQVLPPLVSKLLAGGVPVEDFTPTTPASAGEPKAQSKDLRGVDRG